MSRLHHLRVGAHPQTAILSDILSCLKILTEIWFYTLVVWYKKPITTSFKTPGYQRKSERLNVIF